MSQATEASSRNIMKRPQYAIESVDNALRLLLLLRQEGPMRGADIAERLGVARSTAHRLLSMLVYREFAEQLPNRNYGIGRVMRSHPPSVSRVAHLREAAEIHMRALTDATGETTNLQVLVGDRVRFVLSVESQQTLRVGDREGRLLPATQVSGGKAILAASTNEEVTALLTREESLPPSGIKMFLTELEIIRNHGFAVNNEESEVGVVAIGKAINDPSGRPIGAVSLSLPSVRYDAKHMRSWVTAITDAVEGIEDDLASAPAPPTN